MAELALALSVTGAIMMLFASGPQYKISWDVWKKDARAWNQFVLKSDGKSGCPVIVTSPLLHLLGFGLILLGNALYAYLLVTGRSAG